MKTEIDKYHPCKEGIKFRSRFNSFEEAWNACENVDWMLWIADKVGVKHIIINATRYKIFKETVIDFEYPSLLGINDIIKLHKKVASDICHKNLTDEVFRLIKK